MSDSRHEKHEILNLIGLGLANFDLVFVRAFSFATKTAFYKSMISKDMVDFIGTINNRQDLFDPLVAISEKAGGKKETIISIEKLLLTHYLQAMTPASLQAL